MINKFFDFMLAGYNDCSLEKRIKAKIILTIDSILIVLLVIIGFIQIFFVKQFLIMLLFISVSFIVLLLVFYFIRVNKFEIASNTNIIISFVALFASLLVRTYESSLELYKHVFLSTAVLIEACLIGYSLGQIVVVGVLGVSGGIFMLMTRVLPNSASPIPGDTIETIASSALFFIICCIMASIVFSTTRRIIRLAEGESAGNVARLEEIGNVLKSSRAGLTIGAKIVEASNELKSTILEIDGELQKTDEEISVLKDVMIRTKSINEDVLETKSDVKRKLTEQAASVSESVAAVEEMVRSIDNLSRVALDKKRFSDRLMDVAADGETKMANVLDSIREITQSSAVMAEFLDVIQNIVSRTSILSMNAAIEAAHAGQYGKGFSVVASEIQKLAEETGESARMISESLNKNKEIADGAADSNRQAESIFTTILASITESVHAFDEIINGMEELTIGTKEITIASGQLNEISEAVNASMNRMEATITNSFDDMEKVESITSEIHGRMESIASQSSHVTGKIDSFIELGNDNIHHIRHLDSQIEKIG